MAKHVIGTFSYPLKDAEIIEEAERLAKIDGKSFSQLIMRLLKEEVSQKKVKGNPNPLNIYSLIPKEKPSHSTQQQQQCDIRQWLPRDVAIKMARHMHMDEKQWNHLGDTCHIIARKVRTGYL